MHTYLVEECKLTACRCSTAIKHMNSVVEWCAMVSGVSRSVSGLVKAPVILVDLVNPANLILFKETCLLSAECYSVTSAGADSAS